MAELSTLARPYAKAAFEHALEQGQTAEWSRALGLAAAISHQDKVAELLSSPAETEEQTANTFTDLLGDDMGPAGQNFIQVLAHNKRLPLLPQISEQFNQLLADHGQTVEVTISSAFELDQTQRDKLADKLRETLKKSINITTHIDSTLIGGVLIKAGDLVIDGSVRGKLGKLAEAMNQ